MVSEPTFHRIKTLSFTVLNEVTASPTELINYQTSALFGVAKDPKGIMQLVIRYTVLISNRPEEEKDLVLYGRIETETFFIIPGMKSFFEENLGYRIPKEIIIPLFEAACSTTRGIALTRGAGTLLDNMPIPLIDGTKVLSNIETVDVPISQEEAIKAGLVPA